MGEAALEFGVRAAQRRFGIDVEMAREVDHGKQEVADFAAKRLGVAGVDLRLDLIDLLPDLGEHGARVVPVEADLGRLLLQLQRTRQRGQGDRHAGKRALRRSGVRPACARASARSRFSSALIRPHSALTSSGDQVARVAENMRMTADQFGRDRLDHAAEIEQPCLLGHPRMEHDLQQQVAELLAQIVRIAALDRVGDFVGLFKRVGSDGREGLLEVPRAASPRDRAAPP